MRAIFVTGTDTGVGKTVVTGLVGRFLSSKGYNVITQKWIETGYSPSSNDIDSHLEFMRKKREDIKEYLPYVSPYTFRFPSSPHLASGREKRHITEDKIKRSFNFLQCKFDFVIVEGIGGALVPFNKKRLVIDIAKELDLPTLIVAGNRLGAINHTLLTIEAIRSRNMRIMGIIFNNHEGKTSDAIQRDNPQIVKKLTRQTILGILPWLRNKELLYKAFIPIAKKLKWIHG